MAVHAGSLITASKGTHTMTGTGWDIWGVNDVCTFAALAETACAGFWVCRVTQISNLSEKPSISPEAKVGLMARGDLSNNAAMAVLSVNLGGGIQTEVRLTPGVAPSQTLASSSKTPSKAGLIAPQYLLHSYQGTTNNYLLSSVWLKLQRQGEEWTPFTSLDGKSWTAAGSALRAEMPGAWVGIFATAGNILTGNQGEIQAVIDNLSFTPTQLVELGATSASSSSSS